MKSRGRGLGLYIYIKRNIMGRKKIEEKKIKISVTILPEINEYLNDLLINKEMIAKILPVGLMLLGILFFVAYKMIEILESICKALDCRIEEFLEIIK